LKCLEAEPWLMCLLCDASPVLVVPSRRRRSLWQASCKTCTTQCVTTPTLMAGHCRRRTWNSHQNLYVCSCLHVSHRTPWKLDYAACLIIMATLLL